MIKIEVKITDVGRGVVVELVAGSTNDKSSKERETADRIIEMLNQEILSDSNTHKFYERHTEDQQEGPHRPAHADWVDELLESLWKHDEEEVCDAGSN